MKPHAKTALALALAIVGGIAAGMRCDASVTVETPTQYAPRPAAYTVKAYTEGSDPFIPLRVFASKPFASFALKSFFALNAFNAVFALKTTMEEAK
jgi:hypothetical protein